MIFRKHAIQVPLLLILIFGLLTVSSHAAAAINNSDAIQGQKTSKALFDINLTKAGELDLYLQVIAQTHDDLISQGLDPDFIIAFRGASVRLVSSDIWMFEEKDQEKLKNSAKHLKALKEKGVRLEACNIATTLFKVDNNSVLNEIKIVGNTFVSLIGYQNQGYSIIPIQ